MEFRGTHTKIREFFATVRANLAVTARTSPPPLQNFQTRSWEKSR